MKVLRTSANISGEIFEHWAKQHISKTACSVLNIVPLNTMLHCCGYFKDNACKFVNRCPFLLQERKVILVWVGYLGFPVSLGNKERKVHSSVTKALTQYLIHFMLSLLCWFMGCSQEIVPWFTTTLGGGGTELSELNCCHIIWHYLIYIYIYI